LLRMDALQAMQHSRDQSPRGSERFRQTASIGPYPLAGCRNRVAGPTHSWSSAQWSRLEGQASVPWQRLGDTPDGSAAGVNL